MRGAHRPFRRGIDGTSWGRMGPAAAARIGGKIRCVINHMGRRLPRFKQGSGRRFGIGGNSLKSVEDGQIHADRPSQTPDPSKASGKAACARATSIRNSAS